MKKNTIIWIAVLGVLVLLFVWGNNRYNYMVSGEELVSKAWSDVESQYQRRSDLLPNLVETVKGYAKHEKSTLQAVIEARAKATQVTVNPDNMTPEKLAEYQAAQSQVGSAIGRLLVSVEQYPDLKANQNFKELQAQLESTENRIAVHRQRFNDMAQKYNVLIRRFPSNIIASMFGFEKKGYFEAEAGSEKAPQLNFD
jgi:LemA protein